MSDWTCVGCEKVIKVVDWDSQRNDKTKVANYCECHWHHYMCLSCLPDSCVEYEYSQHRPRDERDERYEKHEYHNNIAYEDLPCHMQSH
jgi:hypothetical protein